MKTNSSQAVAGPIHWQVRLLACWFSGATALLAMRARQAD